MPLLLLFALLVVIGVIAVASTGRGDAMPDAEPDRAPWGRLPPGRVTREDVDDLHFSLAFRGYRMSEVDDVLDRLAAQLAEQGEALAWYERRYGRHLPDPAERAERAERAGPVAPAPPAERQRSDRDEG